MSATSNEPRTEPLQFDLGSGDYIWVEAPDRKSRTVAMTVYTAYQPPSMRVSSCHHFTVEALPALRALVRTLEQMEPASDAAEAGGQA